MNELSAVLRRYGRVLVSVVLTVICILSVHLFVLHGFEIHTIEVASTEVDIALDEKSMPGNLLFFPRKSFTRQILADNPHLSRLEITKTYPHTLRIVPVPRRGVLILDTGVQQLRVDRYGVVLSNVVGSTATYPLVALPLPTYAIGDVIEDPRMGTVLEFLYATRDIISVHSVTSLDHLNLQVEADDTNIYIAQDADISEVVTTLQQLLAGFRIKGTLPPVIDLRYARPIIQ